MVMTEKRFVFKISPSSDESHAFPYPTNETPVKCCLAMGGRARVIAVAQDKSNLEGLKQNMRFSQRHDS